MSTAIDTLGGKKGPSASGYRQGVELGMLDGQGSSRTQGGHEGPSALLSLAKSAGDPRKIKRKS